MQLSMDIIADELKDILQYARFPGSTGLTITSVRFCGSRRMRGVHPRFIFAARRRVTSDPTITC